MFVHSTLHKKHITSCILLCSVAFLLLACGTTVESAFSTPTVVSAMKPGDYQQTLNVGDQSRSYTIHLPPAISSTQPLPLVVVLHDTGGNAAGIAHTTNVNAEADQEGFVVVYPNAIAQVSNTKQRTWNCCGPAEKKSAGVDDVGFIHLLVEHLQNTYTIDARRIYATGMADGGAMAYRLACDLSTTFAAIAPVAANFAYTQCQPAQAVSVAHIHGAADSTVQQSAYNAVSFWVQQNQCTTVARRESNGNIIKVTYTDGQSGTEVILYTIIGGTHTWSSPTTTLIWNFFAQHPKL